LQTINENSTPLQTESFGRKVQSGCLESSLPCFYNSAKNMISLLNWKRWGSRLSAVALASGFLGLSSALIDQAQAATFTVINTNDSGAGSLRRAINDANAAVGPDNIRISATSAVLLKSALPDLSDVTIEGPGAYVLNVQRDASLSTKFRIFTVPVGVTASILNLSITNGNVPDSGGGIRNSGTLTLAHCRLAYNTAGQDGGAISNSEASLTISDTVFIGNRAQMNGGAISSDARINENGEPQGTTYLSVFDSEFSDNTGGINGGAISSLNTLLTIQNERMERNSAGEKGGGIYTMDKTAAIEGTSFSYNRAKEGGGVYSASEATLINSTFSNNTAVVRGGGICNASQFSKLDSCTLTLNTAPTGQGTGIVTVGNDGRATTSLTNSIVSGNRISTGTAGQSYGSDLDIVEKTIENQNPFSSGGYNLIGTGNATGVFGSSEAIGDFVGVTDPGLNALTNNGGFSPMHSSLTHSLKANSPALDTGNTTLAFDQRGVGRPQGKSDDIGAFEAPADKIVPTIAISTPTQNQNVDAAGFDAVTGTASDDRGVSLVQVKLFRTRNNVRTYWNGSSFVTAETALTATLSTPNATNTTWSYAISPALKAALDAGAYTIYALAKDYYGNQGNAVGRSFNVSFDKEKPSIVTLTPSHMQVVSLGTLNITGTTTDDVGVVSVAIKLFRTRDGVRVYWNGSAFVTTETALTATLASPGAKSTKWSYPISNALKAALDSGDMTIYANARDASGKQGDAAERTFIVDVTKPLIATVFPAQNATIAISSFNTITGTASDSGGVSLVQIKLFRTRNGVRTYWNGKAFVTTETALNVILASSGATATNWKFTVLGSLRAALDNGPYTIYALAKDKAGNQGDAVGRTFVFSGGAPLLGSSANGS
jgi:predicted outer membrane repeat protein